MSKKRGDVPGVPARYQRRAKPCQRTPSSCSRSAWGTVSNAVGRSAFYPGQVMRRDAPSILAEYKREAMTWLMAAPGLDYRRRQFFRPARGHRRGQRALAADGGT